MTFNLPCSCGRIVRVRAGDAGRSVKCKCGTAVEVPSLSQLRALARDEKADQEPQVAQRVRTSDDPNAPIWSIVGGLLVLFGSCLSGVSRAQPVYDLGTLLDRMIASSVAFAVVIGGNFLFGRSFKRSWWFCAVCAPFAIIGMAVLFFAPKRR